MHGGSGPLRRARDRQRCRPASTARLRAVAIADVEAVMPYVLRFTLTLAERPHSTQQWFRDPAAKVQIGHARARTTMSDANYALTPFSTSQISPAFPCALPPLAPHLLC
jgi:hypothetical protein